MIQLNLLPDIKLDYIRAQRMRRTVLVIAVLISAGALALLILVLIVNGVQKKHLNDLTADVTSETKQLQGKKDIGKILTVQNQLSSLTTLHNQKPALPRLLGDLNRLTPTNVAITDFSADFTANTMTITGKADTLSSVNKYVDTLKFTNIRAEDTENTRAFSDVVLTSFGYASDVQDGKPANYTITLTYDPLIFDITTESELLIPNTTTTRSALDASLFQTSNRKTSN